jgi:predicted Zn-dependent protease
MIGADRILSFVVSLWLVGAATPAHGQAAARLSTPVPFVDRIAEARSIAGDSARRLALDGVMTDLLREVETTERRALGALRSTSSRTPDTTLVRRYAAARDGLAALLAALDAEGDWGTRRFGTLRVIYPDSPMLIEAGARRAARTGAADSALAAYDRLLRRDPANLAWQRARAATLESLGRRTDARRAWAVSLDLEPLHEETFRAAVRLATSDDALEQLLQQVRRHRLGQPNVRVLGDREVELLQRLGRPDEAAKVAEQLTRRRPA